MTIWDLHTDILVVGAGESGTGAALLAKAKGYPVFVSDAGQIQPAYKELLQAAGIGFEEGGHSEEKTTSAGLVIKSPGISPKSPVVARFLEADIEVIDEIEFASRFCQAKTIAITGSNGKTTSTLLAQHLMLTCGLNSGIGGNVGESFARQLIGTKPDWFVLEVSSFQLDGTSQFSPDIAVITNITPDHLDRYEYKFEKYVASKFRISANQSKDQYLIVSGQDEVISSYIKSQSIHAKVIRVTAEPGGDVWLENGSFHFNLPGQSFSLPVNSLSLRGLHNQMNAMMAAAAVALAGGSVNGIKQGLSTFKNAPHRLEEAGEIEGILFVNDSKATNVDSVKYALGSFEQPIVLILGGVDKGNDYSLIDHLVAKSVKAIVAMGTDNTPIIRHFGKSVEHLADTNSLEKALDAALGFASKGDVVLLSPACASFDLFKNYEDRGRQFINMVQQFKHARHAS